MDKVFSVVIPKDNPYWGSPEDVTRNVIPYIKMLVPHARLTQEDAGTWKLTTPDLTAVVITGILSAHYGFIVSERAD